MCGGFEMLLGCRVSSMSVVFSNLSTTQGRATSRPHPRCLGRAAVRPASEGRLGLSFCTVLYRRHTQPQFHWQQNPQTLRPLVERFGKEMPLSELARLRSNLSAFWRWYQDLLAVYMVNRQTRIVAVDRVDQQASFTQAGLAGMALQCSVCSLSVRLVILLHHPSPVLVSAWVVRIYKPRPRDLVPSFRSWTQRHQVTLSTHDRNDLLQCPQPENRSLGQCGC
jgi:hypothetical protein